MTETPRTPFRVQIALFDGVDPLDAIGPFEVLHAAGMLSGGAVEVELAHVDTPGRIQTGVTMTLEATTTIDLARADVLLLPGAAGRTGDNRTDDPGDDGEVDPDSIPARLGRAVASPLTDVIASALDDDDKIVACVCGGSLIPAMAGLIEGRNAVTHHLGMDLLDATGVHAIPARIVDDGDLISGGGVTSGIDVALYLVERFVGPRIARAVEDLFEFERRGTVWHPTGPKPEAA